MSRAGRALGPTAKISALAALLMVALDPDLAALLKEEVDQRCG
jgi:hypothetical protein